MERIKLCVSGSQIEVVEHPGVITAGTVGVTAEFVFDSHWDGLSKIVVFRAGEKVVTAALEQDSHIVPWEVLEKPNLWLCVGVYGANAEGTVVIPTLWAKVAVVHTGVDPEGDPALDPTAPVWQELLTRIDEVVPDIYTHINSAGSNPHGVTCEQIGAVEDTLYQLFCNAMDTEIGNHEVRLSNVEGVAESADFHTVAKNNPHKVTAEQIGAAKAVVVTVDGSTPSLTSEEIYNLIQEGNLVYLHLWGNTYISCCASTPSEAKFENSVVTTTTAANGKSYNAQRFRLYFIKNDRYAAQQTIESPSIDYLNAQIQYYLNQ